METGNYQVVVRETGMPDVIGASKTWGDAYRDYEEQAKTINELDPDGNYLHPELRLSIRRTQ